MFQNFDTPDGPANVKSRVAALRKALKKSRLDGFIVPHADEHQSEYLPPHAELLAWISGFTGSAGAAIILTKKAAIFVDGRYTLQIRSQTNKRVFKPQSLIDTPPSVWLAMETRPGDRIGFDPKLHTISGVKALEAACLKSGARLIPVKQNLIDQVWQDQPTAPVGKVFRHPLSLAGKSAPDKITKIREILANAGSEATVLTLPDSICWLFNFRGQDIAHNPVALCYAIVPRKGKPTMFIDAAKLSAMVWNNLRTICHFKPVRALEPALAGLGARAKQIQIDASTASHWIKTAIEKGNRKANIKYAPDPIIALKAIKNKAEIMGARAAHERDGIAMCRFLAWLDREAPKGKIDEISAAQKLEECRMETGKLKEISFDTISGSGPNGAIVHYRVNHQSNRTLDQNSLYLVDSGAQYSDGTTDITRTIAIGKPSLEMCDRFTRVLKGHIAIAAARFPETTSGAQIDILARKALWDIGLDYAHGTGHGVGAYLSVHEGPQGISKRAHTALEPGMIVSNEPGYYKAGSYGIRIENLVLVTKDKSDGEETTMLAFETLTLAPIDLRLVKRDLLEKAEINWLNAYHKRVFATLNPSLKGRDKAWLKQATKAI
ncbi:MAG: aminopeptidase P family protein [Rhizobiales bacterium]|nr:aminopeptidase P family protein [Hyphomicrobiales bacterium]